MVAYLTDKKHWTLDYIYTLDLRQVQELLLLDNSVQLKFYELNKKENKNNSNNNDKSNKKQDDVEKLTALINMPGIKMSQKDRGKILKLIEKKQKEKNKK